MTGAVDRLRDALERGDERAARACVVDAGAGGRTDDDVLELLAREAGPDRLATELLIEAIDDTGLARAAVGRVLVAETAVDDVSQEVLIAVARSVASFRGDARFTTWLFEVARNRAIDHLRRQRATAPLDDHDVGEVERMSSIISTRASAQALVDRLPEDYRRVVWLREVEQWPYREVAEHLDLNENTVKARVARGRAILATYLSGLDAAPGAAAGDGT